MRGGEIAEEGEFAFFATEAVALEFDEEAGLRRIGGRGRVGGGEDRGDFFECGGGGGENLVDHRRGPGLEPRF